MAPVSAGGPRPSLPVTVVVPVRNEEKNIAECLTRLRGFAGVLVVDSGSTDRTCDIAREHGARVITFEWDGRFPKKRNWVLRTQAIETPWVLFLDADEFITPEFIAELRSAIEGTSRVGFWLAYRNHFMGRYLRHGDVLTKLALFRVGAGEYEKIDDDYWSNLDMEVHEHPVLEGETGSISSPILHRDFKGMRAYFDRHNQYSSWEAHRYHAMRADLAARWSTLTLRQKFKYRLLDTWLLGPAFFAYSYVFRLGFLDRLPGFVYALCKCMYFWQIKIKLRELKL